MLAKADRPLSGSTVGLIGMSKNKQCTKVIYIIKYKLKLFPEM